MTALAIFIILSSVAIMAIVGAMGFLEGIRPEPRCDWCGAKREDLASTPWGDLCDSCRGAYERNEAEISAALAAADDMGYEPPTGVGVPSYVDPWEDQ